MSGQATPRTGPATRAVAAWSLWDWGSQAYSTVIVSFVFAPYLVSVAGDPTEVGLRGSTWLAIATAVAGIGVFLMAPVMGQRADAGGQRKRSLATWTALVVLSTVGLFFVRDNAAYFWLGLVLLAAGSMFMEFAGVSYNAMLHQVSTPATIGRISGIGWGSGYLGGIIVLLLGYVAFIAPDVGLFGVTSDDGLSFRAVALVCAIWFAVFALPVFFAVPEIPPTPGLPSVGFLAAYGVLFGEVRSLWRRDRHSVWYLLASALYRDGLAAIFSFGAVLAVTVYGLTASEVIVFGIVANVIAAAGAFAAGLVEDRVGPKIVILVSLAALIVSSVVLLFAEGKTMFWIFGLALTLWVGPAQASSRSYLARLAPVGREGQMFGLYATTGRAVSWLAPSLFAVFTIAFASDRAGILGIALVLVAGFVALSRVNPPRRTQTSVGASVAGLPKEH